MFAVSECFSPNYKAYQFFNEGNVHVGVVLELMKEDASDYGLLFKARRNASLAMLKATLPTASLHTAALLSKMIEEALLPSSGGLRGEGEVMGKDARELLRVIAQYQAGKLFKYETQHEPRRAATLYVQLLVIYAACVVLVDQPVVLEGAVLPCECTREAE